MAIRLEPPFQHEFRFVLFLPNSADNLFVQAGRERVSFNIADESIFVFGVDEILDRGGFRTHFSSSLLGEQSLARIFYPAKFLPCSRLSIETAFC
jgi:hypothetical protein